MEYEVVQSQDISGEWRVECIDFESDGQIYVATFSGPNARDRARICCVEKRRRHRISRSVIDFRVDPCNAGLRA